MENYNVLDIAKYFIESGILLSHKKLQKLVYYAYSWYLVKNNSSDNVDNRLFDSSIEAWIHGPVCPDLYKAYNINAIINYEGKEIDKETKKILDLVIDIYGEYTGEELELLAHEENPWINARKGYTTYQKSNEKIEDIDIYNFYSNKIA